MLKKTSLFAIAGLAFVAAPSDANAEDIDFAKQIWPMIQNSCAKCHLPEHKDERGRTRRPKGDLVVTSKEALMKGGEGGAVIEAGAPKDSSFLQRTMLDISHDDHMPPEGKADPWTDEQKELFAAWIEAGAEFGDWTADEKYNNPPVEEDE